MFSQEKTSVSEYLKDSIQLLLTCEWVGQVWGFGIIPYKNTETSSMDSFKYLMGVDIIINPKALI